MVESLCYPPEAITTLLIGCNPIQNLKKFKLGNVIWDNFYLGFQIMLTGLYYSNIKIDNEI